MLQLFKKLGFKSFIGTDFLRKCAAAPFVFVPLLIVDTSAKRNAHL
jgi:hypothetical protein